MTPSKPPPAPPKQHPRVRLKQRQHTWAGPLDMPKHALFLWAERRHAAGPWLADAIGVDLRDASKFISGAKMPELHNALMIEWATRGEVPVHSWVGYAHSRNGGKLGKYPVQRLRASLGVVHSARQRRREQKRNKWWQKLKLPAWILRELKLWRRTRALSRVFKPDPLRVIVEMQRRKGLASGKEAVMAVASKRKFMNVLSALHIDEEYAGAEFEVKYWSRAVGPLGVFINGRAVIAQLEPTEQQREVARSLRSPVTMDGGAWFAVDFESSHREWKRELQRRGAW